MPRSENLSQPKRTTESFPVANEVTSIPPCGVEKTRLAPANREIGRVPMTDDRRMLSIADFCRRYSIGKTFAYAEMASGRLRFCQAGRRRLIRVDDAENWAASKLQPLPSGAGPVSAPGAQ
jgi:hypothetical protein